jgi:hypothetical protein
VHRRALLLLVCLVVGFAAALALRSLTGSDWAWGAVPVSVALGWLGVADPTRCDLAAPGTGAASPQPDAPRPGERPVRPS